MKLPFVPAVWFLPLISDAANATSTQSFLTAHRCTVYLGQKHAFSTGYFCHTFTGFRSGKSNSLSLFLFSNSQVIKTLLFECGLCLSHPNKPWLRHVTQASCLSRQENSPFPTTVQRPWCLALHCSCSWGAAVSAASVEHR